MFQLMENLLNHLKLIVVYPQDQSLVHYSSCYILMIYQILVLNFYLFANDNNIYYEFKSLQELEKIINKELNKLYCG